MDFGLFGKAPFPAQCQYLAGLYHYVAATGDLALVGPNCSGMLNYLHKAALWPFDHGGQPVERGAAFITQSGMLGNTVSSGLGNIFGGGGMDDIFGTGMGSSMQLPTGTGGFNLY